MFFGSISPLLDPAHISRCVVRFTTMKTTQNISDPAAWHRRLCHINEWLAVSGDLDTARPDIAAAQLQTWIDEGITDIIDLRGEWSDENFVAKHAPEFNYHYLGTHDDGGWQEDECLSVCVVQTSSAPASLVVRTALNQRANSSTVRPAD